MIEKFEKFFSDDLDLRTEELFITAGFCSMSFKNLTKTQVMDILRYAHEVAEIEYHNSNSFNPDNRIKVEE